MFVSSSHVTFEFLCLIMQRNAEFGRCCVESEIKLVRDNVEHVFALSLLLTLQQTTMSDARIFYHVIIFHSEVDNNKKSVIILHTSTERWRITYFSSLSPSDPDSSTLSGLKRSLISRTFVYPFLNRSRVYQNVSTEKRLALSRGFSEFFCSLCSMLHALVTVMMTDDDVYQHSIKSPVCSYTN